MLNRTNYLIKERVGFFKLTDRYDVYAPEDGRLIGFAQEKVGWFNHLMRLLVHKQMLPTLVEIREREDAAPLITIQRGITLLRAKVQVMDQTGKPIGYLRSKLFSLGGGFYVYDMSDRQVAEVKGDWKGWNFQMLDAGGKELGTVTKKWAGIGRELFTSADNYMIALNDTTQANPALAALLLTAGLAIDIVFKEKN
jgi:uncharacterized protein YxjI